MSFIEEQRKQILEENNTAQADFLDILEHLPPTSTVIDVRTSLSGDIDCEVLAKCNFTGITAILFAPGNITSLKNIPGGVTKIVCAENYLTDIPADLPASIVELDLQKNAIRTAAGPWSADLKELTLSDNNISSLEELPKEVEVLRIDNNRLKVLKLEGLEKLRVLHCSGNPGLIIENLPDTLTDFQMDNDVITEINKLKEKGEKNPAEKKANYMESLRTFFEMKKVYEDQNLKMKRTIYKDAKSKKEAKKKMATLKPKCAYCSRPVGSVFKREGRKYIARCGDAAHPCAFHIELFGGEYDEIEEMMETYPDMIEFTKQNIIIDKLDVLFQYISEKTGVELFKDNLDSYTRFNVHYKDVKKEYDNLYFDEEKEEKLATKHKKIGEIQDRIRELIKTYSIEENPEVLKDAMTVYVEELVPEMNNEAILKYDIRELNKNESKEMTEVFQKGWRLNQLEYTFGEYPRVIHFHV